MGTWNSLYNPDLLKGADGKVRSLLQSKLPVWSSWSWGVSPAVWSSLTPFMAMCISQLHTDFQHHFQKRSVFCLLLTPSSPPAEPWDILSSWFLPARAEAQHLSDVSFCRSCHHSKHITLLWAVRGKIITLVSTCITFLRKNATALQICDSWILQWFCEVGSIKSQNEGKIWPALIYYHGELRSFWPLPLCRQRIKHYPRTERQSFGRCRHSIAAASPQPSSQLWSNKPGTPPPPQRSLTTINASHCCTPEVTNLLSFFFFFSPMHCC